MPDIASWLTKLGLSRYADLFAENEVDFDALQYLSEEDLKGIGLPLGPRRKVLAAIAAFAKQEIEESIAVSASPIQQSEAERRQLTVMFVDLVDSTALSARHDPEDMRETIGTYQDAVASEIVRFDGHVAKFMGDGVLAYFGWPRAHEEEAERAVRAGLSVVQRVALLKGPAGEPLSCRVGIATGSVVVGDLTGGGGAQEEAVVGATPNLAARLQEVASAGHVVIAEQTRRLLGSDFLVEDLGNLTLKGFTAALRAFAISGERSVESRFAARTLTSIVPLVGREEELSILLRRWDRAKRNEGQIVVVSGEPGIGKSRLVQDLLKQISGEPHVRIDYQCSPLHVDSAFHPVIAQISRDAGLEAQDLPEQKIEKLRAALMLRGDSAPLNDATVFAALLSLPAGEHLSEIEPDPERRRQQIFATLLHQIEGLTRQQPLICVFEDMHWADPSTREFVERLVEWIPSRSVLVLVTCRPEYASTWTGLAHSTFMALNRMSTSNSAELITRLAGEKRLSDDIVRQIVDKTDGIPLFIEELTRTTLEAGAIVPERLTAQRAVPRESLVPATLHDSLMARLDRFPDIRDVAQLGAVIGRSFDYKLFAAVADRDDEKLTTALANLEKAGLLIRRGNPPDSSYTFKHALIQDVAYGSMLRAKRQDYHRRVAEVLERLSPGIVETDPALLAHHYAQGGESASAIRYLRRAGKRAAETAANAEAADNFAKALTFLQCVPEGPEQAREEIDIRLGLGGAQVQEIGPASAEAEATYIRALELSEHWGTPQQRFAASWGMWYVHYHRGNEHRAREFGDALLPLAQALNDAALILEAHHVQWGTLTLTGDFRKALAHTEEGISIYERDRHHWLTFVYGGHDPGGCALGLNAVILCLLGYPERARRQCAAALSLAHEVNHPYTVFEALFDALLVDLITIDQDAVDQHTSEFDALLSKLSLVIGGVNSGCRGWLVAERGLLERGLDLMCNAQSNWHSHFGPWCYPLDASLASLLGRAGRGAEALELVNQCLQTAEQGGAHWWDSEFYRVRAGLHGSENAHSRRAAEADLEKAVADARNRNARYLELRAAKELARLWADGSESRRAFDLLAPIYEWFTEGLESPDLIEAQNLLATLR